ALGACFGGLELGGGGCQRGAIRPSRWGRWQAGALLGSRLPQQECPGEEEEAGGDAGKKTTHEISFWQGDSAPGHRPDWSLFCQLCSRQPPAETVPKHRCSPARSPFRLERLATAAVADRERGQRR